MRWSNSQYRISLKCVIIRYWLKLSCHHYTVTGFCFQSQNRHPRISCHKEFFPTVRFFLMALQPLWALAALQFPDLFTIGRTPWNSDQLVSRPLLKHMTTQTQKNIHTPNIYALSEIRTHDHSVRASEDSSCLGPLDYRDRPSRNVTC
jgi:hypothetical protein